MEKSAGKLLPQGFSFEWTALALQQKRAGNTAAVVIDRGPGAEIRQALGIAVFLVWPA